MRAASRMCPSPPARTLVAMYFTMNRVVLLDCMPNGQHGPVQKTIEVLESLLTSNSSVDFEHHLVQCDEDLWEVLEDLRTDAEAGIRPLLHIESHGTDTGLHIDSRELVTWQDLADPLRRLNIAAENNVFLMLASCEGASCCTLLEIGEPAAVYGFLGARSEVKPTAGELRVRYEAYYRKLFGGAPPDGNAALAAFNEALESGRDRFFARDAALYLLEAAAGEEDVDPAKFAEARARVLMIDRYPHLEARFAGVTLEAAERMRR